MVLAQDWAGWLATETRTIEVEATIEGLICAKHRFYDMGWIYGSGVHGIVTGDVPQRGGRRTTCNVTQPRVLKC